MKRLLCLFCIVFAFNSMQGQNISLGGGGGGSSMDSTKNFQFLPIPYINYNRSTGLALGLLPMAMYKVNKEDTVSPASVSGLIGVYTTNDSWFGMFFQQLYLKQDTWRITAAGGLGNYNFQFYVPLPVNDFLDYNTSFLFLYANVNRRVVNDLYAGIHFTYLQFDTQFGEIPQPKTTEQYGTGIVLSYDKRTDVYYPRGGYISNANWSTFPTWLGNDNQSDKIELDHNHYFPSRSDKDVIACRAKVGLGIGSLPFEQQFIIGREDIRGYSEGRYRGEQMVALQGEYRWNFHKKMSAVGFFGLASIFGSINEDQNGEILPGLGTGFRYNVFEQYHMNVGFDIAVGKNDWGFYFRIGEAF